MCDQFRGKMPLFNSVQFDSYQHIHKEAGFSTKYWTMPELFKFARNNLHVNYLFWSNKYARVPWDSYTVADAYPVMANNPSFGIDGVNASAMPDGADNVDTDQDRLTDAEELALGTDPTRADTDWDSIIDGNEVKIYGTDPLAWDTDGEGLDDGSEVKIYGTNPLARNTDKDWLNDRVEVLFKGTDPLNADTDGDGLSDGLEASSSKGIGTNPLLADSDGGGINDGEEYRRGTNPLKAFYD